MFCKNCGKEVNDNAVICVHCGCAVTQVDPGVNPIDAASASPKSKTTALVLCILLGYIGVHRFYAGKIGTGILMLFTGGCCGILTLIDFVKIITNKFTDSNGQKIIN